MHVIRYLWVALIGIVVFAAGSILFLPDAHLMDYTGTVLLVSSIALLVLTALSLQKDGEASEMRKTLMMSAFLFVILVPTVYAMGAFIHEDQTSWSRGEVHWHADFEVIVQTDTQLEGQNCRAYEEGYLCQLDLIDPSRYCQTYKEGSQYMCRLNSWTGQPSMHEHNDQRIHMEGVFKTQEEATLAAFFESWGGKLTDNGFTFVTDHGTITCREQEDITFKLVAKTGLAADRGWEVIEEPADYIIKPEQRGVDFLDNLFFICDDTDAEDALEDLQEDDKYRGFDITKGGAGY